MKFTHFTTETGKWEKVHLPVPCWFEWGLGQCEIRVGFAWHLSDEIGGQMWVRLPLHDRTIHPGLSQDPIQSPSQLKSININSRKNIFVQSSQKNVLIDRQHGFDKWYDLISLEYNCPSLCCQIWKFDPKMGRSHALWFECQVRYLRWNKFQCVTDVLNEIVWPFKSSMLPYSGYRRFP